MTAADRVLARLYDRVEGFFSLDELVAAEGLAPGELAGVLDELSRAGHGLERSPAHGVRLVRPARPHAHLIERGLGTERIGRSAICFEEVGSTNDVAWDSARRGGAHGTHRDTSHELAPAQSILHGMAPFRKRTLAAAGPRGPRPSNHGSVGRPSGQRREEASIRRSRRSRRLTNGKRQMRNRGCSPAGGGDADRGAHPSGGSPGVSP